MSNVDLAGYMVVFEAVVREGGFSAAAKTLGLSKATVSKQVAQLEEALGVRLLQRTTRMVAPTDAGHLFFERCADLTLLVSDAGSLMSSLQDDIRGKMRISIPSTYGNEFLNQPIINFLRQFPNIHMDVDVNDTPVDILNQGFDLAIRVGPVSQQNIVTHKLCETRKLVVASPSLIKEAGLPETPEELSTRPCLLYEHQRPRDRWLFQREEELLAVPVYGRVRSTGGDILAAAACQGLGFAWLPDFIVRPYIARGQLVSVLSEYAQRASLVRALLPVRKHVPLKVREFIAFLKRELREISKDVGKTPVNA